MEQDDEIDYSYAISNCHGGSILRELCLNKITRATYYIYVYVYICNRRRFLSMYMCCVTYTTYAMSSSCCCSLDILAQVAALC
jgi:hypothetical protein